MPSDTYAVRLTDSNKDHDLPRRVMKEWLDAGYDKQTILIYALYALAKVPIPVAKQNENTALNKLVDILPRLERALDKIDGLQGVVSIGEMKQAIADEIDPNLMDSILGYFDSTQK